MAEILSKTEFAAQLGVKPSALSNYIARGDLNAPALRRDGTVDLVLAMRQLRNGLDLTRSTGLGAPGAATIVGPPVERPEGLSEQRTLCGRAPSPPPSRPSAQAGSSAPKPASTSSRAGCRRMANAVAKILRDIEEGLSKKSTPVKRACREDEPVPRIPARDHKSPP